MLTSDRLTLLVSLVPYLRARGGPVSVTEASEHFDVAPKAIRDAVRLIAVSGRPGELGTYQDLDLFDINWDALEHDDEIVVTRFIALEDAPPMSTLETAALLAGLQYLRRLPAMAEPEAIDRLIAKLAPETMTATITVDAGTADAPLASLHEALERGRRVTFAYRSPSSPASQRRVDPIRLEALDEAWYLRAWCLDREAERTFLVDRMRDVRVLDESSRAHDTAPVDDALFTPAETNPVVTLDVAVSALPLVREYLPDRRTPPVPDGAERVRVEVRAASWEHFARLACANAGRIRVVAPREAREFVSDWARRGLSASND